MNSITIHGSLNKLFLFKFQFILKNVYISNNAIINQGVLNVYIYVFFGGDDGAC
jgi:hypothetical protein